MTYTATYSPEDNKLRLYTSSRLDPDTYARVKAAGFIWAPKQDLFVAPMWTPEREDLLTELAGEIGDEDTSLVDRAEERAERFEGYSDSRAADACNARAAVDRIADGIPLGQPILVGHHSERHARRDAEKIENGMRRAVKMWETSEYWKYRAAGAIRHAKYKERPDVRARRIKGLESDKRKTEKTRAELETAIKVWSGITDTEKALFIAGHTNTAGYGLYTELREGKITGEEAARRVVDSAQRSIARCDRWIAHYSNRLEYERAMLAEQGGTADGRPKAAAFDIQVGGRVLVGRDWYTVTKVNRKGGETVSVTTNSTYCRVKGLEEISDYQVPTAEQVETVKAATKQPPLVNYRAPGCVEMTTQQWKDRTKYSGSSYVSEFNEKGGEARRGMIGEGVAAYRQRSILGKDHGRVPVFLTDAKETLPPTAKAETVTIPAPTRDARHADTPVNRRVSSLDELHEELFYKYESGKLKAGIKYEYAGEGVAECYQYSTLANLIEEARALEQQPRMVRYSIVTHSGEYKNMRTLYTWCAFDALKDAATKGVQVVSAPQLFPTPPELAARMVEAAGIEPGARVLEPSAGTGRILQAIRNATGGAAVCTAVEINLNLCNRLRLDFDDVRQADFLQCNGDLGTFDAILMNPPFANGDDIRHIEHARHMLKPGGRLVAICANGPRQQAKLKPIAEETGGYWEDLPAGTFAESGTNVNAALLVIEGRPCE